MQAFSRQELDDAHRRGGRLYHEFLRVPSMSAGLYRIPAGGKDPQGPHSEDEVYHVVSGRARFRAGGESRAVGPGDVLFVPAHEEHRFEDVEEDLTVLVVFSPAEYTLKR